MKINKIEKIDVYDYPVDLSEDVVRLPNGSVKVVREPFEYKVIDKINEIIDKLNKQGV